MLAVIAVSGCATVNRGAIPVVDASAPVSEGGGRPSYQASPPAAAQPAAPTDSGVVVMVPQTTGAPLQTFPAPEQGLPVEPAPMSTPGQWGASSQPPQTPGMAQPSGPSGVPSAGGLAEDEQLEGPVLALLTTAQQQQSGGDLNGAASSLERAQRIAPREPQVLYRLAEVRLAQGDVAQTEQLARRALSYASGRPALQASLWNLIAQARERMGDAAGAAQARERARVGA
ncbi:tetratricopeptide repeat protein [Stutzerimonas urumqiensis]